jgi:WD40 repeat protein
MKQHKKQHLWLMSLVILMVGCSALGGDPPPPRVTPQSTSVLTPIYPTLPLTPQNGTRAVELATLSTESSGPIAALAFTSDGRELLAVHGIEGVLQRWRVEDGVLLSTMDVSPVGMAAVAFDAQARLVAIGAGQTEPAIQAGYAADVSGARVWDTRSGELILDTSEYGGYATDVALSSDGRWLVEAYPDGLDVLETGTGVSVGGFAVVTCEWKEGHGCPSITAATFGPAGTWLAFADDTGWVKIEEWDPKVPGLGWTLHWEERVETPLALAIDPSRQQMAAVTTAHLLMWDLQARFRKEVLKESVPPSPLAGLAFSPDGALLAVGTTSGWQLWSVGNKKLLLENERATFAVTFSPDGRLFAWGDTEGDIHLWGVPAP